jgi:hypothetical protein
MMTTVPLCATQEACASANGGEGAATATACAAPDAGACGDSPPEAARLPCRGHGPATSRASVVSSRELVSLILQFLAGPSPSAMTSFGRATRVCRLWRDAARGDEVWGPLGGRVLPVLGAGVGGGRAYVLEHARCLHERRVWVGEDWWKGLRVHFELCDERDGLRLLSVEGGLQVKIMAGAAGDDPPTVFFLAGGADRTEVVGPAFSAASRDPAQHRYGSIEDYLLRMHDPELPGALRVRVAVRDTRTARQVGPWLHDIHVCYTGLP